MARVVRPPVKGRRRTDRAKHERVGQDYESSDPTAQELIIQVFGRRELLAITSDEEIDLQITAFAAVIIKQCIQSWYGQITTDREFVEHVRQMVAAVLQELHRRLKVVDLKVFVLDEIPALLDDHLQAIEYSSSSTDRRSTFHALRSHPAVDDDNALAWSQSIAAKLLPVLLEARDADNPALRVLLSEVISEIILYRGLYLKACEPSFIWESISRLMPVHQPTPAQSLLTMVSLIWDWILLGAMFCWRAIVRPLKQEHVEQPILATRIWSLLNTTLQINRRMPWLYGMVVAFQWALLTQARGLCYELDRFLSKQLDERLHNADTISSLIKQFRHSLFPSGALVSPRPVLPPSVDYQSLNGCSIAIVEAIPPRLRTIYFAVDDGDQMRLDVRRSLEAFDDVSINRVLSVAIVELVVAKLFPELTE